MKVSKQAMFTIIDAITHFKFCADMDIEDPPQFGQSPELALIRSRDCARILPSLIRAANALNRGKAATIHFEFTPAHLKREKEASLVSTSLAKKLRDNPIAISEGSAGAPKIHIE